MKWLGFTLLAWSLVSPSNFAAAEAPSCQSINLYELPNRPFDRIPIYDQGELSTCYAYTAAQMIDFWRFQKDPNSNDLTSPLWTALIHKIKVPIHWSPDSLDFSRMNWVFKSLEESGICQEAVVDRAVDRLRNGNTALSEPDLMYFFQTLWDEYQNQFHAFGTSDEVYARSYEKVAALPVFEGKIIYSLQDKFRFITHYFKGQRLETLMKEVFSECTGDNLLPVQFPERESLGLGFASNRKLINRIEKVLLEDIPMGVGYCSSLLDEGPGFHGIRTKPRLLGMAINNKKCGAHYSVVVGQRPAANGSCQFLIRNSYGSNFWTDRWSCFCESKDKSLPGYQECRASDARSKNLQVLGCWIDAEDLANNIFDLTYFKN